jgi:hypothetical protein
VDEQFDERQARTVELCLFNFLRGHFADDFIEGAFGDALKVAVQAYRSLNYSIGLGVR